MPKAEPRHWSTLRVRRIEGEVLRFEVESASKPDQPHTVDLSENEGHGACSCWAWVRWCAPKIKAGRPLFAEETSCAHLLAARAYFMRWAVAGVLRKTNQTPE